MVIVFLHIERVPWNSSLCRNYIGYSKSSAAVQLMQKIKGVFDPQGIMNPYKVLPDRPL